MEIAPHVFGVARLLASLACLSLCFFGFFSCLVFVGLFLPFVLPSVGAPSTHIITVPRTGVSHTIGF